jgi:fructose-1-phosphate kinase PfkB-like protein
MMMVVVVVGFDSYALIHCGIVVLVDWCVAFIQQLQQETKKVMVEFSHDQLYNFYTHLETVQEQLDALG